MRQNKWTILGFTAFVVFLLAITLLASHRLHAKLQAGEAQIIALEQAMETENARTEEIRDRQEYMQSDAYMEQVAKDKLGLIHDGEIIFKEADKE